MKVSQEATYSRRDYAMQFIWDQCCPDPQSAEFLKDHIMWTLECFDDDTLAAAEQVACLTGRNKDFRDTSILRSLIMNEEPIDLRTIANHAISVESKEIDLDDLSLLIGTLRHLGLMGSDDEFYPHLGSHFKFLRYEKTGRTAYHQNDELVRLVHEYPSLNAQIIDLRYVQGIKDVGLAKEHLLNKAPALADGIL